LTLEELSLIDDEIRVRKGTPADARRRVNVLRARQGIAPIHRSTVHRYTSGYGLRSLGLRAHAQQSIFDLGLF